MPIPIEYHDEETGETWEEMCLIDDDDCREVLWTYRGLMENTIQVWPTLVVPRKIQEYLDSFGGLGSV